MHTSNMQRRRKHETDLSTRANKCLITCTRDRGRSTIPLFTSRNIYSFFIYIYKRMLSARPILLSLFLLVATRAEVQRLNARTKEGLQRRDTNEIRSSVQSIVFQRLLDPNFDFALLSEGTFRAAATWRIRLTFCRNFIRPRLRASFESNRLAIGARHSYLPRECATCR